MKEVVASGITAFDTQLPNPPNYNRPPRLSMLLSPYICPSPGMADSRKSIYTKRLITILLIRLKRLPELLSG